MLSARFISIAAVDIQRDLLGDIARSIIIITMHNLHLWSIAVKNI